MSPKRRLLNLRDSTPEPQVLHPVVRVRGLTRRLRYFDEETFVLRLKRGSIVIRLGQRLDLNSELQVTDMRTSRGGAYRVVWMSPCTQEGMSFLGLELLDPKADIWRPGSVADTAANEHAAPAALLECRQCSQRISTPQSEVDPEYITEGFTITHQCDTCNAETGWTYCGEASLAVEAPPLEQAAPPLEATPATEATAESPARRFAERRQIARMRLGLPIKVIRAKVGQPVYELCVTANVSRSGISFTAEQDYEPGEIVQIILPYHADSMAAPLPATVLREEASEGTQQKRVAVQFISSALPKAA